MLRPIRSVGRILDFTALWCSLTPLSPVITLCRHPISESFALRCFTRRRSGVSKISRCIQDIDIVGDFVFIHLECLHDINCVSDCWTWVLIFHRNTITLVAFIYRVSRQPHCEGTVLWIVSVVQNFRCNWHEPTTFCCLRGKILLMLSHFTEEDFIGQGAHWPFVVGTTFNNSMQLYMSVYTLEEPFIHAPRHSSNISPMWWELGWITFWQ